MTDRTPRLNSRDVGLEIALILGGYFLKTEHLHYGYWPEDLPVDPLNLRIAQDNYCKFLLSHFPRGIRRVLDVGCGGGALAQQMLEAGYEVSCVSPSPFLTRRVRVQLKDTVKVHETKFEDMPAQTKFDLVLFSESFQYIKPVQSLAQAQRLLNEGGYVLICDFFQRDGVEGRCKIGGGHKLELFRQTLATMSFELLEDIDITPQVAPTIDLEAEIYTKVVGPLHDSVNAYLMSRYRLLTRMARWLFRKKIAKIQWKYFEGDRDAAHFAHFKTYRLMLLRKTAVPTSAGLN